MISLLLTLPLSVPAAAFAQSTAPAPVPASLSATPRIEAAPPTASGRPGKAVQRIRIEDAGSRIDEVRVGGETQSITVQPKTGINLPPYEVKPSGSAASTFSNQTNGPRVWNVQKF